MSENKAKKLFGSITNIGDDIIEEAQAIVSRALRPKRDSLNTIT